MADLFDALWPEAVAELTAAGTRVCGEVSASRARQVNWVLRELAAAVEHPRFRPATGVPSVTLLLAPGSVSSYLQLAEAGELRTRAASAGNPASTPDSMNIRGRVLRLLAEKLHLDSPLPRERVREQSPKAPVEKPTRDIFAGYVAQQAGAHRDNPEYARLFLMVGLVLDCAARTGEISNLRLVDLDVHSAEPSAVIERRPQKSAAPAVRVRYPLSPGTAAAARQWLEHRERLLHRQQSTRERPTNRLITSVRANYEERDVAGEPVISPRPPGLPLQPRGLGRAYERGVGRANFELLGEPGFTVLPRRLEALRRSSDAGPGVPVTADN